MAHSRSHGAAIAGVSSSTMKARSLVVPLVSLLVVACKAEDSPGADEIGGSSESAADTESSTESTTTTTTTTTDTTSEEGNFIPSDTSSETGEPPPDPKTCREMLDCVFMCLGDLGLECLQTCGEGFDPAEAQKAGALVVCLGQACAAEGQCSLTDLTSTECVGCIGLGLFLPEPPGCEAEALACE